MSLKSKTGFGQTWSNDKLNYLKWKTFEYQVVRDHQDPNFLYRPFSVWESLSKQYSLNLESHINYMKLYVRIADFQLQLPNPLSNAKNGPYIKCRSWWVEQYWYSWLFRSRPSRVPKTNAWLWILSKFKIEWFKLFQKKSWPLDKM